MQEKSAVGSATGFMGDLGLRQLLDGAQLVLNRGPRVFPPPARCGRRLLSPLLRRSLGTLSEQGFRRRSVPLLLALSLRLPPSSKEHSGLISGAEETGFRRNDLRTLRSLTPLISCGVA